MYLSIYSGGHPPTWRDHPHRHWSSGNADSEDSLIDLATHSAGHHAGIDRHLVAHPEKPNDHSDIAVFERVTPNGDCIFQRRCLGLPDN